MGGSILIRSKGLPLRGPPIQNGRAIRAQGLPLCDPPIQNGRAKVGPMERGGGPPPGDPQIQNGRVRCGSGEGGHRKLDNDGLTGIRSKGSLLEDTPTFLI